MRIHHIGGLSKFDWIRFTIQIFFAGAHAAWVEALFPGPVYLDPQVPGALRFPSPLPLPVRVSDQMARETVEQELQLGGKLLAFITSRSFFRGSRWLMCASSSLTEASTSPGGFSSPSSPKGNSSRWSAKQGFFVVVFLRIVPLHRLANSEIPAGVSGVVSLCCVLLLHACTSWIFGVRSGPKIFSSALSSCSVLN